MNTWFTVVIFALLGSAGCEVTNHFPDHIAEQQDKRHLCSLLIASHRSILESMFEVELDAVSYETDEWHGALESLEVATTDPSGHPRNPSSVLQSTIDKLEQVKNAADPCARRTCYLAVGRLWKRDDGLMLTVSQTPLMTDDNPVRRASQIPWIPHPFPYGRVTWND